MGRGVNLLFTLCIFNRHGVAGAVLLTALSFIHSLTDSLIHPVPLNLKDIPKSQPVGVRENIHPPPCATFHVSHVRSHVSGVRCNITLKKIAHSLGAS